jgi:uncharacterized membrane protein YphA (DoxX/SURF4 family)
MESRPQLKDAVHSTRYGLSDLAFRILFSSIFVGLGGEHIFSDKLLLLLMPDWVPFPRAVSIGCGVFLLAGSATILLGFHMRRGAQALALFLIAVTLSVHLPGLLERPPEVDESSYWIWDMFQRSNFVKNICLLGVCIYLMEHRPGRFSLDYHRAPNT